MYKKSLLISLAIFFLFNSANAQWGGDRSSLSLGFLYDWQTDKGSPVSFRKGTNVGMRIMLEGEFNDYLSYRLHATIPGLFEGIVYDRLGYGMADMCLSLTNYYSWDRECNVYTFLGGGLSYGVVNNRLFGVCIDTGLGWSYWLGEVLGPYAEADLTFFSGSNSISVTLVLGIRMKL